MLARKFQSLNAESRRAFYGVMSRSLAEGIPQTETLRHMKAGLPVRSPLHRASSTMLRSIQRGRPLSDGLVGLVPHDELLMIRAGEETEHAHSGYVNALRMLDLKEEIRGAIVGAISGPGIALLAFFGFFALLSLQVLPKIEQYIPRDSWPPSGQLLGRLADNLPWIAGLVGGMIVALFLLVVFVLPRWSSPARRRLDLIMPFVRLNARLSGIQFLSALTGFVRSGIPVGEAIIRIKKDSLPYIASLCNDVLRSTRHGDSPAKAIGELSCFNPSDKWLFAVYGLIGDLSGAFSVITDEMAKRIVATMQRAGKLSGLLIMSLIAGGVLFFYMSMMSIVYSAQQM